MVGTDFAGAIAPTRAGSAKGSACPGDPDVHDGRAGTVPAGDLRERPASAHVKIIAQYCGSGVPFDEDHSFSPIKLTRTIAGYRCGMTIYDLAPNSLAISRNLNFWILPEGVRGIVSTISNRSG